MALKYASFETPSEKIHNSGNPNIHIIYVKRYKYAKYVVKKSYFIKILLNLSVEIDEKNENKF